MEGSGIRTFEKLFFYPSCINIPMYLKFVNDITSTKFKSHSQTEFIEEILNQYCKISVGSISNKKFHTEH